MHSHLRLIIAQLLSVKASKSLCNTITAATLSLAQIY